MKKFWWLSFNLLVAVVSACQPVTQSTEQSMLKPGDVIDGMTITTGAAKTPPLWAFCPPAIENDGILSVDCQVPQLAELAIGHTFGVADQALQTLDWSTLTWELDLDGHLLDLESFGTYDYVMPDLAPHPSPIREVFRPMRDWDVVLTNPKPGMHTLHGVARAETDTYGWVVNFYISGPSDP